MKNSRRISRPAAGLALAAALHAVAAPVPADKARAITVPTVTVQRAGAASVMLLDGALQPVRQSTVAAQLSGTVMALLVKAGDHVRAGTPLARLDPREPQAGVARADAAVAQAQAALTAAQQNATRTRELRTQGFISQAALDTALTQLDGAQAGLAQAIAERRQATLVSGHAEVSAPFSGVVLETHVEVGDLALAGRPVVTLYEPGALRAVVQVPMSRSALALAARELTVELPDGRSVTPVRRQPLPSADAVSQTVEWRLPLAASDSARLRPGQSVRIRFSGPAPSVGADRKGALSAPPSAVLRRGELTAVYAVDNGQFVLRQVRSGASLGDRIELLAGVQEGQVIAADAVRAGLLGAQPAGNADPR